MFTTRTISQYHSGYETLFRFEIASCLIISVAEATVGLETLHDRYTTYLPQKKHGVRTQPCVYLYVYLLAVIRYIIHVRIEIYQLIFKKERCLQGPFLFEDAEVYILSQV